MKLQGAEWFGHYRLSSRIATGGMAEVYLGRHVTAEGRFGPMVAVKRLLPHFVRDTAIVRMFINEAQITAQIHHPNVVKIVEVGQVGNEPFIAMELLEGHTFAEMRQQAAQMARRVPLGITLRVLAEACRGLNAAHHAVDQHGRLLCIVHRDFTPDNVHVGVDGDVKVIDFGIAKADTVTGATEPGTLKGKFFYMSPEMIGGRPVDHRADVFAAGVMLYEQLCGRRPFTGMTTEQVLDRISEGNPKRPSEFDPSVPRDVEDICLQALAKDPADRFDTVQHFVNAMETVGGSAEMASREQLAAYLQMLFPVQEDLKRQTLRRAIQADPSMPAVRRAGSPSAGNPAAAVASASPSVAVVPSPGPAAPKKAPRPPLSGAQLRLALAGAGAIVLVVGLVFGARALLHRAKILPADRLTQARAATSRDGRSELLRPLAEDPVAIASQLEEGGNLLLQIGAYDAALPFAETFEKRFPKEETAALLAAKAAMHLRQGKRAEDAIERAAKLAPVDIEPLLLLIDLRETQGDTSGAITALEHARKLHPDRVDLVVRHGTLLSQSGRLEEAAALFAGVLQQRFDPAAAAELAFVRMRQEKPDLALPLLKKALKKDPKLFSGHYYLGAILFGQGDSKGAVHEYREADALAPPDDARALSALCAIVAKGGDAAEVANLKKQLAVRFPSQSKELKDACVPPPEKHE